MKGAKTMFVCRECGATSIKWLGRCPDCDSWNTFDEVAVQKEDKKAQAKTSTNRAERFDEMEMPKYLRTHTGMNELDRVLGGGLVDGSVVLLSGEPGKVNQHFFCKSVPK